jgi:hypothetical protein
VPALGHPAAFGHRRSGSRSQGRRQLHPRVRARCALSLNCRRRASDGSIPERENRGKTNALTDLRVSECNWVGSEISCFGFYDIPSAAGVNGKESDSQKKTSRRNRESTAHDPRTSPVVTACWTRGATRCGDFHAVCATACPQHARPANLQEGILFLQPPTQWRAERCPRLVMHVGGRPPPRHSPVPLPLPASKVRRSRGWCRACRKECQSAQCRSPDPGKATDRANRVTQRDSGGRRMKDSRGPRFSLRPVTVRR